MKQVAGRVLCFSLTFSNPAISCRASSLTTLPSAPGHESLGKARVCEMCGSHGTTSLDPLDLRVKTVQTCRGYIKCDLECRFNSSSCNPPQQIPIDPNSNWIPISSNIHEFPMSFSNITCHNLWPTRPSSMPAILRRVGGKLCRSCSSWTTQTLWQQRIGRIGRIDADVLLCSSFSSGSESISCILKTFRAN